MYWYAPPGYWIVLIVECGYACHAKCQMKAPQDCTGVNVKLEAKKSKKKKKGNKGDAGDDADAESVFGNGSLRRSSTDSSVAPSIVTPTSPNRKSSLVSAIRSPTLTRKSSAAQQAKPVSLPTSPKTTNGGSAGLKARVLYKYDATSNEELSVKPGDVLNVVEKDDGSGWITARIGRDEGIVPAAYVEIQQSSGMDLPKKGPPVAPRRGAKKVDEPRKRMFKALYDYDANTELELSIREGDMLSLVAEDKGDGWTEVEIKGKVGSVPSNYIEPA